jgi:hypothetical protein
VRVDVTGMQHNPGLWDMRMKKGLDQNGRALFGYELADPKEGSALNYSTSSSIQKLRFV